MIGKVAKLIAAGCLSLAAMSVSAQGVTYYIGNQLMEWNSSNTAFDKGRFMGYVVGIVDAKSRGWESTRLSCVPSGVTVRQLQEVVRKYLKQNPQEWHLEADLLVTFAMMEAFPCPK